MNGSVVYAGKYKLKITPEGFSLWDVVEKRWLIDASYIRDDGRFRIGRCMTKRVRDVSEMNPTYTSRLVRF